MPERRIAWWCIPMLPHACHRCWDPWAVMGMPNWWGSIWSQLTAEQAYVLLVFANRFCLTAFRHSWANPNPCSFRSSGLLLQPAGLWVIENKSFLAWKQAGGFTLQASWHKNFKVWAAGQNLRSCKTCFHKRKRLIMGLRFPWWNYKSITDTYTDLFPWLQEEANKKLILQSQFQTCFGQTHNWKLLFFAFHSAFSLSIYHDIWWFLSAFLVFFCISWENLFKQSLSYSWAILV